MPRMPLISQLARIDTMGVMSSSCITPGGLTRHWTIRPLTMFTMVVRNTGSRPEQRQPIAPKSFCRCTSTCPAWERLTKRRSNR